MAIEKDMVESSLAMKVELFIYAIYMHICTFICEIYIIYTYYTYIHVCIYTCIYIYIQDFIQAFCLQLFSPKIQFLYCLHSSLCHEVPP